MNTENNNLKGPMDDQVVQIKTPEGGVRNMSMREVIAEDAVLARGVEMANMLISKAMEQKNPSEEFLVLRYAAIHLLGSQVFNIGMGSTTEEENKAWDASRAFAAEKDVHDHLSTNVKAWKNLFDNGHIRFAKNKIDG